MIDRHGLPAYVTGIGAKGSVIYSADAGPRVSRRDPHRRADHLSRMAVPAERRRVQVPVGQVRDLDALRLAHRGGRPALRRQPRGVRAGRHQVTASPREPRTPHRSAGRANARGHRRGRPGRHAGRLPSRQPRRRGALRTVRPCRRRAGIRLVTISRAGFENPSRDRVEASRARQAMPPRSRITSAPSSFFVDGLVRRRAQMRSRARGCAHPVRSAARSPGSRPTTRKAWTGRPGWGGRPDRVSARRGDPDELLRWMRPPVDVLSAIEPNVDRVRPPELDLRGR